jgi:transposase-like protein
MGINGQALLEEYGIRNQDEAALVETCNKAMEAYNRAKERLDAANQALAEAEDQPDVEAEALQLIQSMEELGVDEKAIRSALRTKYGVKRTSKPDSGSDLTDEVKEEMLEVVRASAGDGFKVTALASQFDVKRSQVASWVKSLVDDGAVVKHGSKRGTTYYLPGYNPEEEVETQAA